MSCFSCILILRRNFASVSELSIVRSHSLPSSAEFPLYRNVFDRVDDPKLWLKDTNKFTHDKPKTLGDLIIPHGSGHAFFTCNVLKYRHYFLIWDPIFPRTPDLSKGELISGATFTRTSGWHRPGEPAIVSVGKLGPDNQRPAGYAENISVHDSINPDIIPDFREYRLPPNVDRRPAIYLITASALFFILALTRSVICKVAHYFWLSKDVTAGGSVEVNVSHLGPGDQIVVKWRSKPVFIKRRTKEEIASARRDDAYIDRMKDPQLDSERSINPEWLVNIGVCTHLGCIPVKGGNYGGYFCPCHGSHYDSSGRIRQGPAPSNLAIPPYEFLDDNTIKLG